MAQSGRPAAGQEQEYAGLNSPDDLCESAGAGFVSRTRLLVALCTAGCGHASLHIFQ